MGCKRKSVDLVGQRFGALVVISRGPSGPHGVTWHCQCDCGNMYCVCTAYLRNGHTKSCGCKRKIGGALGPNPTEQRTLRLYGIWQKAEDAHALCIEWHLDFSAFVDWSIDNGYASDRRLMRSDKTKPFSPDNCRWIDKERRTENGIAESVGKETH